MKFLFDECLPIKFPRTLSVLDQSLSYTILHIKDLGFGGLPDSDWIAKLPLNEQWAIITRDDAMRTAVLERLALKEAKHIVFYLREQWEHATLHEQSWRLVRWWPEIVAAAFRAERGTAFRVPYRGNPGRLIAWEE